MTRNALIDATRTIRALLLASMMIAITVAVSGCGDADGAEPDPVNPESAPVRLVPVETMIVSPKAFSERVEVNGVVDAVNDVAISAEAGGRVVDILPLGSEVGMGAVIARFDDRVLKSQLESAEANYKLAEDTFRRQEAMYRDSVISALEYENVRTQRDRALALVEQARKMFSDTKLTSPIRGRVEDRFVEAGELVAPGSPVARVVDTRRVKVRAGVPERYASDIREGAMAWIRLPATGKEHESALSFVSRVVDAKSRTFDVEIELENIEARLKPEMIVDVSIERQSMTEALVVPQSALVRDDLGIGLFVVTQKGDGHIAVRRTVKQGPSFGGNAVIESGIQSGEQIVVVGQSNLTDGNSVEIRKAASE